MDTFRKDLPISVFISSVTHNVWAFVRMKNVSEKTEMDILYQVHFFFKS